MAGTPTGCKLLPGSRHRATNGTGWDTARVIAVATNQTYTDFYVASDLLNWSTNYHQDTNYTLMGLLARCTSPDITVGS